MNLAVFGATGGAGRHLVAQTLAAGHRVTALARDPAGVTDQARLTVVRGDARDAEAVAAVVRGQDAVLVAVGTSARRGLNEGQGGTRGSAISVACRRHRGSGLVTVCADTVANTLAAMARHGVRRLVVLSAYGAAETHDGGLYDRVVWLVQGRKMLDKERMEELVRRSAVDWTVVRPPALTNGPRTGRYRVGEDLRIGLTSRISRADVADFMLRAAADAACVGRALTIAS